MKYLLPILLVLLAACSAPRNQEALNTDPSHPCILVAIQKGADSPFKQGLCRDQGFAGSDSAEALTRRR